MAKEHSYHDLRVFLIGIGGVSNYGCEAIMRGTEEIIRIAEKQGKVVL